MTETGFRPARRSEAKPLIGLYAESGSGKTYSSLLLARGFVGPTGRIGMIETEGGRGEANVGREPIGDYLVRPIRQNFSPQEYGQAISEAESANLGALIIDSASHEWEGAGGVLSMAADNQAKGVKGVLVWQQPKILHQRHFMLRLMQTPIPLVIVCMRAKYPMEQARNKKGEMEWTRSKNLEPIQAADILFEMFVHGWIDNEHQLHVTKYTLPDLENFITDGQPITVATGARLAAWAKGSAVPEQNQETGDLVATSSTTTGPWAEQASPWGGLLPRNPTYESMEKCLMMAQEAASRGKEVFRIYYKGCTPAEQGMLRSMKPEIESLYPKEETAGGG